MRKPNLIRPIVLLAALLIFAACAPASAPVQEPASTPSPTLVQEKPVTPLEKPLPDSQGDTRGVLPPQPVEPDDPNRSTAYVDSATLQTDPTTGEMAVFVTGNLADGCTELADIQQIFVDERLTITLYTSRDPDLLCTQALVPFETFVPVQAPIQTQDLVSGRIPVQVNGVVMTQLE